MINNIRIYLALIPTLLWSLPSGSTVVSGGATVSTGSKTVSVSTTNETNVINWTNFNIAADESVTFSRTGANLNDTYHVVNIVTGNLATTIQGGVFGGNNCKFYLVNPNGVIIDSTGQIVSGGVFVSGLSLTGTFQPDMNLTFTGTGTVSFSGTATATNGDAIFLGYRVTTSSSSSINASNTAVLAAGTDLIFQPSNEERIYIQTAGSPSTGTGVDHTGTISANSIMMKADGNIYSLAINHSGIISASSCSSSGGKIKLIADPKTNAKGAVEISGSVTRGCSSGTGPSVEIYGHSIALLSGSSINTAGITGGAVTIGSTATYPSANVYFDPSATITTTGTTGNGGAVSMIGSTSLLYLGTTNTSTSSTGNAGNITITSTGYLGVNGSANLGSTTGTKGSFTATGSTIKVGDPANYGTNFTPPNYTSSSVDSVITKTSLEQILGSGAVNIVGTDIDLLTNDITWSSGCRLSLTASDQIDIAKLFTMTGVGFDGTSVFSMTSPIINITAASTVGIHLTSGDIAVNASNLLYLTGAPSGFSYIRTDDGDIAIHFGNYLNMRGSGGEARISAENVTINGLSSGVGDVSLKGESCGTAYIIGTESVSIGTTTAVDDVEVIAGECGSSLVTYISGGSVTMNMSGDVTVQGGASGSGNIAQIITPNGSQKDIRITADNVYLNAGASGANNSAIVMNNSNDGALVITTTNDVILNAGGSGTTGSIAQLFSKLNTFTVGRDFTLLGGGGVASLASVYGYNGNTINVTGDIGIYSGSAANTHAKIETEYGHIGITSGGSIYMYTGNSILSDVYVTSNNGNVSFTAAADMRMRGNCSIPNKSYIYSNGTGNVALSAVHDITRIGNTEVTAKGTGTFAVSNGNYTFVGCGGNITPVIAAEPFDYYYYTFLYELFYRLNYFTWYDWYLFHSTDFWDRHTYTSY